MDVDESAAEVQLDVRVAQLCALGLSEQQALEALHGSDQAGSVLGEEISEEISDDALILAVVRVRTTGAAKTAAQTLAVLEGEGYAVTLSRVKKACSKAAKRMGGLPGHAAPPS